MDAMPTASSPPPRKRTSARSISLITSLSQRPCGGVPQLAARIPVGTVIDHGDNRESTERSAPFKSGRPTRRFWRPRNSSASPSNREIAFRSRNAGDGPEFGWCHDQSSVGGSGRKTPPARTSNTIPRTRLRTSAPWGSWLHSANEKFSIWVSNPLTRKCELVCPNNNWERSMSYRFSPWLVSERQPCFFECDRRLELQSSDNEPRRVGLLRRGTLLKSRHDSESWHPTSPMKVAQHTTSAPSSSPTQKARTRQLP